MGPAYTLTKGVADSKVLLALRDVLATYECQTKSFQIWPAPEGMPPKQWDLAVTTIPLSIKPGSDINKSITVNHNWQLSRLQKEENFRTKEVTGNHCVQNFYFIDIEV